ncbi:MAG: MoxR family ATPase [Oscillospiraceae bacterium]|jgi:MoxR-like ATPase|nr:MoxR family ATPase [Oscillospiraceae bacterium]
MNVKIQQIKESISKVIVGKDIAITQTIIALLCGGHILLEDVPGVGKTRLATALAKSVNGKFNRIQLTPDVMPSDITGFSMVNQITHEFEYREGSAMCNFLLADEINRASPKVQSALLEAMEEGQLTVDGVTHPLPQPFMVLATQNPVETSGTYRLPEAQTDRFFMRIKMGYPTQQEEMKIFDNNAKNNTDFETSITIDEVLLLKKEIEHIKVAPQVKEYIINLTSKTRKDDDVLLGVSPRGSIALFQGIKALAFIFERDFAIPEDVKELAVSILSHRIILSAKGKSKFLNTENYVTELLKIVNVPI